MSYFDEAYKILKNVIVNKKYLSQALSSLNKANSKIVTRIVYGVLENNIKLEYIIKQFVKKIENAAIEILLKIGTYSLIYLDNVPNYAIVNECVNVCKKNKMIKYSGLANAVLKKVSRNEYLLPNTLSTPENISIMYSKPLWFVKKIISRFGIDVAQKIFENSESKNTIRVNQKLISIDDFKKLLEQYNIKYELTVLNNVLIICNNDLSQINSKYYTHQSLGSVIIVDTFSNNKTSNILDCCASPGGKAIYMAEKFDCNILACDIYQHRIELIQKYAQRLLVNNISTQICDSTVLNENFIDKFDKILCDVPCSGTGTYISKPDIFLDMQEDLTQLNAIQLAILTNASKYVKHGGEIVYSTCSILQEENDDIIKRFLAQNSDYFVEEVSLPVYSHRTAYGNTLLPNISQSEGFFVTKIRRK